MRTKENKTKWSKITNAKPFVKFITPVLAISMMIAGCDKNDDDNVSNDTNITTPASTMNNQDRAFMPAMANANLAEVDLGNLAAQRSTDAEVKAFAQRMVSEHTLSQNELNTLASNKQVTLPAVPDSMHQALRQQLSQLSGRAFDSTYIHSQVRDHQATLSLINTEISSGQDVDVKSYATKNKPHVQMHLDQAQGIATRF
jgi:putative membrane protein